jgi:hypothetical protein
MSDGMIPVVVVRSTWMPDGPKRMSAIWSFPSDAAKR